MVRHRHSHVKRASTNRYGDLGNCDLLVLEPDSVNYTCLPKAQGTMAAQFICLIWYVYRIALLVCVGRRHFYRYFIVV
jgi:hypothetical protein